MAAGSVSSALSAGPAQDRDNRSPRIGSSASGQVWSFGSAANLTPARHIGRAAIFDYATYFQEQGEPGARIENPKVRRGEAEAESTAGVEAEENQGSGESALGAADIHRSRTARRGIADHLLRGRHPHSLHGSPRQLEHPHRHGWHGRCFRAGDLADSLPACDRHRASCHPQNLTLAATSLPSSRCRRGWQLGWGEVLWGISCRL